MQKVILITGVSSGFGKATAEMLRAKGHIIYGTSRNILRNNNINNLVMDVTKPETIKQAVAEIMAKEGRIDVLINNAGMGIGGAIELATEEEIQLQMGTNFRGMANVCREVLPVMRRQRSGKKYHADLLHRNRELCCLPLKQQQAELTQENRRGQET
ncbi:MAG: SDR family NAD(P)-dependent oxidoreductase, partial [Bacteroidales bacterium]|nr:SDR family NAD(P)-dependent oxidoreductase [Bacteroidales bacterium]